MDSETFIYCCPRCGQIFESISNKAIYCPACRPANQREKSRAYYERNRERVREKSRLLYQATKRSPTLRQQPSKSIKEICEQAAALHMTYGEYVAKYKE